MAGNVESYQQLLAWLEVGPDDLRLIREAIFNRIFPGGVETRSVVKFRYVVIPLVLDIMDSFFPATCCIEANTYFFDLLDQAESKGEIHISLELARNFMRYLAGLVVLGPNRISPAVITDVTSQCFPALITIFNADDEPRGPSSGKLEILQENEHFGNESLVLTMEASIDNGSSDDEAPAVAPDVALVAPDAASANDSSSRRNVVSRTVLGGTVLGGFDG